MVAISQLWYNGSYTIAAKPIKTLESHYTMIQFLINNNSLHLARKYAQIFVRGRYLFREANSFPRAKLEENCELRGTDNVQGQISEHIFKVKSVEAFVFIILQIFFATCKICQSVICQSCQSFSIGFQNFHVFRFSRKHMLEEKVHHFKARYKWWSRL